MSAECHHGRTAMGSCVLRHDESCPLDLPPLLRVDDDIHVGQLRDGDVTVLGDLIDAGPLYPASIQAGSCAACRLPIEENDPVVYVTVTTLGRHQVMVHEACSWPALQGGQR